MRTYYLFHMNKECYAYYQKKPEELYQILMHLFRLPKQACHCGVSFYKQLCNRYDIEILNSYLEGKYKFKNENGIYTFQNGNRIQVKSSCCIVRSESNFPSLFRTFYYYSRHIFVCDFYNQDYFFLTKHYHEIRKPEYNKLGVEKTSNF